MSDDTLKAGRGAAVATMREPAQEITIRAIAWRVGAPLARLDPTTGLIMRQIYRFLFDLL
jgi:hypothetical protein